MFQHLGGPGLDAEPLFLGLAVSFRRARRKSCESFEKSVNSAKIHLKAPQRCSTPFLDSKVATFWAQMARRPQAGREILAKMINIFPTFRCTSPNSQHQHLGSAVSTKFHFLTGPGPRRDGVDAFLSTYFHPLSREAAL